MMKTLAALLLAVSLLGCSGTPDDSSDDTSSDDLSAKKKNPLAPVTTKSAFDVTVNASTVHVSADQHDIGLDVPDLWRHVAFSHQPRVWTGFPAEEGCGQSCANAVIARAAKTGGVLSGTLTVVRSFRDIHHDDGTCALGLEEEVTLDLKPLTMSDGSAPTVELYAEACPK